MNVSEDLLLEANAILDNASAEGRVEGQIASISCSLCGAGCSGIVGD